MSDMLAMISAEPAAAVATDKTAAKTAAKSAGKAETDKSFEQLLTKEDLPQDMPTVRPEQVEIAAEVELGEAATLVVDDIEAVDPAPSGSEPAVVFSVAHAALQASLEVTAPSPADPEQPAIAEVAPILPLDENLAPSLVPEVISDDVEGIVAEQDGRAGDAADLAPLRPVAAIAAVAAEPAASDIVRHLGDHILPIQSDKAHADMTPASDVSDQVPLIQAPKLEAKPVAVQDLVSVQAPQSDEPPAMTSLTPLQTKEAAAFDKLVAQAATAQGLPDEKPVASPLVRNILDRMQELEVSEGKTRILLRPQGMGALEIDILRQADGRMHLAIRVENPLVLDALRNESGALSSFMGEKGFDLSNGGPDLSSYRQMPQSEEAGSEDEADITETETALLDGERVNILT